MIEQMAQATIDIIAPFVGAVLVLVITDWVVVMFKRAFNHD